MVISHFMYVPRDFVMLLQPAILFLFLFVGDKLSQNNEAVTTPLCSSLSVFEKYT